MKTIKVDQYDYQVGRLDAVRQFHVARRLGPVLAVMGITASMLASGKDMSLTDFVPLLGPISEMVAKMSNEDAEYVIYNCLSVVQRAVGDRYAEVTAGNRLMFEDMDMPTMMRLVIEVVRDNLGSFMKGLGAEAPSSPSP